MENSETSSNALENEDLLRGDIGGAIESEFEAVQAAEPQSAAIVEVGNDDDEVIVGTADNDTLRGEGGRDRLLGRAGDDLLDGGKGADTLLGEAGDDRLFGRAGADELRGGLGDDVLNGGGGADDLAGAAGADRLVGGGGRDTMSGGGGADTMLGGGGADEMSGNGGGDQMQGGNGADSMFGNGGRDQINRDNGADEINGGGGSDTLNGDRGRDLIEGGRGRDLISGGDGDDTLNGDNGADTLSGDDGDDSISGGAGDDSLSGDDGEDLLLGGDGDDILNGGDGNDTLVGNKGDDQMFGDDGNDLLVWNNGDGSDLLNGGDGDDTVQVNFNTDLVNDDLQNDDVARISANGENVLFERTEVNGQSEFGLFSLDIQETETLEVNFGGGDDTAVLEDVSATGIAVELDGGEGTDTLDLSAFGNSVTVDFEAGIVVDAATDEVLATFENFENVITGSGDDTLTGDDQNNVLDAGVGANALDGKAGDDLLSIDSDAEVDQVDGGEGFDTFDIDFSADALNEDQASQNIAQFTLDAQNVLLAQAEFNEEFNFALTDPRFLFNLVRPPAEKTVKKVNVNTKKPIMDENAQKGGGPAALDFEFQEFAAQNVEALSVDFGDGNAAVILTDDFAFRFDLDGGGDDNGDVADITTGDTLVTSGLGDPRGKVPVEGVVVDLDKNDDGGEDGTVEIGGAVQPVILSLETEDISENDPEPFNITDFENVIGTIGGDSIEGNAEANVLSGLFGNDILSGDDGNDLLQGGQGADTLIGGAGDDTLSGGDQEFIGRARPPKGGTENDELTGGEGSDTFVFKDEGPGFAPKGGAEKILINLGPFFGEDTVTDFTAQGPSADLIDLSEFVFDVNTFDDLDQEELISQAGDDVIIDVGFDSSIILQNVDLDDLSAVNFLFADDFIDP
jgi:Ca2+-binding RTX toxin-like protein